MTLTQLLQSLIDLSFREDTYYLLEDYYYSKSDILEYIEGDERNGNSFNFLIENNYLSKNKEGYFAFKYVGLISLNDKLLLVFPKYYKMSLLENKNFKIRENNYSDFIQVFKVLKNLSKSNDISEEFNLVFNNRGENELILADEIIRDYFINGVYNKNEETFKINGSGGISWDKTVNKIQPFFSKGRPIYNEFFTSEVLTEHDNIITQIHNWAIKYCLNKYRDFLDIQIIFEYDSVKELMEIGELNFLLSKVKSELSEVFIDRKVRLLHLLSSLLKKQFNQMYSSKITMYGTDTFWSVWEHTCSKAYNNQKEIERFKTTIPNPEWTSFDYKKSIKKNTLVPDIIYGMEQERAFFTIDVKYYLICFEEYGENKLKLEKNPGIADITKQLLYEYSFMEQFKTAYDNWYNLLAFPAPLINHDPIKDNFFGSAKLDLGMFSDKLIWLIYLNPRDVFSCFLSDNTNAGCRLNLILNDDSIVPNHF